MDANPVSYIQVNVFQNYSVTQNDESVSYEIDDVKLIQKKGSAEGHQRWKTNHWIGENEKQKIGEADWVGSGEEGLF